MLHLVALLALCVSRGVRSFAGPVHGYWAGALTLPDQARYAESSLFRLYAGVSELGNVVEGNSGGEFLQTLLRFFTLCEEGKPWPLSARPGTRLPEVKKHKVAYFRCKAQGCLWSSLFQVSFYFRILAWCTTLAMAAAYWCRFSFSFAVVDVVPKEHKDARTRGDRNRRENPKDVNDFHDFK